MVIVAVAGLVPLIVHVASPLARLAPEPLTDGRADESQRLRCLRGLLQRYQGAREFVFDLDLLLDLRELDQLRRELVGVDRAQRILVLQLRRQQLQERREIAGDPVLSHPCRPRKPWRSVGVTAAVTVMGSS